MANSSVSYNPGTATTPRQTGPNTWDIDSFRTDSAYTVTITPDGTRCTCPHWVERLSKLENAVCKHGQAVHARIDAEQQQSRAAKAQALSDEQLLFCAARHAGTPAGAACLTEIANRLAEARMVAARPAIGTCVKVWGPTTDAEAWASLKGAVAA